MTKFVLAANLVDGRACGTALWGSSPAELGQQGTTLACSADREHMLHQTGSGYAPTQKRRQHRARMALLHPFHQVVELADAALERAPRDVEATWVRAELAEAAGDDELARQLFRQLTTEFDLDPTARTEIDARLEQLGSEPGERR